MDLLKKIAIVAFFILSAVILAKTLFIGNYLDFNTFYFATKAYYDGFNPYTQISSMLVGFLYAPTSFIFFSPFIIFPLKAASQLWVACSIALLISSVILLFRINQRKIQSFEFLGLLGAVFMMFPVKFTLGMGQVGIVNLFLVVYFLYYSSQKREKLSALFLSLSLLLKFSPLLFPFYLLIRKKWRVLTTCILISLFIIGIVTLYRPDQMIYFVTKSLPGTFTTWPLAYYNQAFSGGIGRSLGRGETAQVVKLFMTLGSLVLTFYVLWKKRNHKKNEQLGFVSLLPLSIIIAPLAWQHYFVLVIPTLIVLYFRFREKRASMIEWSLLSISYLLIAANIKNPQAVPQIIQSHVLLGAMLLWGLSLYEIYKHE